MGPRCDCVELLDLLMEKMSHEHETHSQMIVIQLNIYILALT